MTEQEKWNFIVKLVFENKGKREEDIQRLWESIFYETLGYSKLNKELISHFGVQIGSRERVITDIVLCENGEMRVVVELKQPKYRFEKVFEGQLFSYLNQLKCNIGILICDKMYLYNYEYSKNSEQTVVSIGFYENNPYGIAFVSYISKGLFDLGKTKNFIDIAFEKQKVELISPEFKPILATEPGPRPKPSLVEVVKGNTIRVRTNAELLNYLFGTNYKQWMKCASPYKEGIIWMVEFNSERITDGWRNILSPDGNTIYESYIGQEKDRKNTHKDHGADIRYTFKKNISYERNYTYLGKFIYDEKSDYNNHIWHLISDKF